MIFDYVLYSLSTWRRLYITIQAPTRARADAMLQDRLLDIGVHVAELPDWKLGAITQRSSER